MPPESQRRRHSQASRASRRRRLYALLLVIVLAGGLGLFLLVRSGAEVGGGVAATDGTSTTIGPTATVIGPIPETTVSTTLPNRELLPSRLPPDAAKVRVPILMYHYVDDVPPPAGPYADGLTVRTRDFRAEMQYLADNGYHTVGFADVYLAMARQKELPPRPVVLTFDDGGLDNYQVAFPILKEHGFTGTFFVITKTVGRTGQMTWDQLREMAAQGMSIESHTVSHPDLQGVSAARLASELSDSRVSIEKAIGQPSYVLCYPSGAYDARVIAATRAAGYLMAVTTDKGEEGDPHAVYEMKRRRVQPHLPLETFAKLVRSAPGDTGSGSGVSPGVSAVHDGGDADQAMTAARAREIGANELGRIPVLMFHLIGHGKGYLAPDALRFDIALLRSHGFYPTSIREMVEGTMKIPAGKSPVVLTFDDSSPGQYRILGDGTIDPECAVGILQAEVARGNWAPRATFFPLLTVNPANVLFGQPELAERKLQNLVEWGYEVGSHGMTHMDFSKATAAQVKRELAQSQRRLETLIGGGYEVFSLSPPYGEYPSDRSLLLSGTYEGYAYKYHAVAMAWGESSPSPFSSSFDPTHIPRITAAAPEAVRKLMKYWNSHRQLLYVSDGDSGTISFPEEASAELGTLRAGLAQKVVEY